MKTYQLKQPLKRMPKASVIQFEDEMFRNQWYIFDSSQITDTLTFKSDHSFKLTRENGHTLHRHSSGQWNYSGWDTFNFQIENKQYELHLVHLDNNLMIFEVQDTKQYFILLSQNALHTLRLTTLYNIEYYLSKLQQQLTEYNTNSVHPQYVTTYLHPILVMGALHGAHLWGHDSHQTNDENQTDTATRKAIDNEVHSDEEILEDLMNEEHEFVIDQNTNYDYYDDEDNEGNDRDDDYSNEYGEFTEEEIIYDYLQSQEEDEDDF